MAGKDWATLIIAIIGMATGIFSLGWNVATYLLRDRPRLKLSHNQGYGILPHLGEGYFISITAANETRHAVVVESVGFDLSNGIQLLFPFTSAYPVPYKVKPGGKYQAWAGRGDIRKQVREQGTGVFVVRIWANDAVGKRWKRTVPRSWSTKLLDVPAK